MIIRSWKEFGAIKGIIMEKVVPKTQQKKGIVECLNKTLKECARHMEIHTSFPKMFWVISINAINLTAYLII